MDRQHQKNLFAEHHPDAIKQRLANGPVKQGISDAVLGAIDGCVTTFAVVSSVVGAGFEPVVAVVMGFANLFADGFSMAISNYEAIKTEQEHMEVVAVKEAFHIDHIPEGEREEIRQIFAGKGFDGELLDNIVTTITSNRGVWIDTMLREEYGLQPGVLHPVRAGLTTFTAFVFVGAMPLLPFLIPGVTLTSGYTLSTVIAAAMFFSIGALKSLLLGRPLLRAGLGTLATGSVAAALAFATGYGLREMFNL